MAIWKKAMDYLGLGPDDAYDDYDLPPEPDPRGARQRQPREPEPIARGPRPVPDYESEVAVRPATRPTFPSRDDQPPTRRPVPAGDDSSVHPRSSNNPPRPPGGRTGGAPVSEPHTIKPRRFDSAQEIADKFKDGQPVIMNLEGTEREVSRRLIDFASGLCYALNGTMEKVASGVYLLKPVPPRSAGYGDDLD
jgi:cell division inhibitor SepF